MSDQNNEPSPSGVSQIMSGATTADERLQQDNFSGVPSVQPQIVAAMGSPTIEQTTLEAHHRDAYASCVASARRPYETEKEAMQHRYAHLELVAHTVEDPRFNLAEFVKAAGKKPTKATRASPYQKVIQLTDTGISKDAASKRGAALSWVLTQCGGATGVAEYFENNGGIPKCYNAALKARREDETDTRSQPPRGRARSSEAARSLSIPVTGLPVGMDGEFTVKIRLANGCGEVVATLSPLAGGQDVVQPTSPSTPNEVSVQSTMPSSDESEGGMPTAELADAAGEQKVVTESIHQSPAEPGLEQVSGAGNSAEQAEQVQIDENQAEKEQV